MSNNVLLVSAKSNCKSNIILSSRLVKYFTRNGYNVIDEVHEADIIVVNTCGFHRETIDISKNIFHKILKNRKEASKVVSVGCLNKINRLELESLSKHLTVIDDLSDFDSLINANKPFDAFNTAYFDNSIFSYIHGKPPKYKRLVSAIYFKTARFLEKFKKNSPAFRGRLEKIKQEDRFENKFYVEIGKGCVSNCSYCSIKKARGNPSSRSISEIVADIKEGYKEGMGLFLVADDCGSYGFDSGKTIFELIETIDLEFPGIPIDLCYVNPLWLERCPDQYLDMFKRFKINSLNVSLQSGSDKIIHLMNRKYYVNNVLDIISKLQIISPATIFWSHFIIGHPSETWRDFFLTVKSTRVFHFFHFFPYSAPGEAENGKKAWSYFLKNNLKTVIMLLTAYRKLLKS